MHHTGQDQRKFYQLPKKPKNNSVLAHFGIHYINTGLYKACENISRKVIVTFLPTTSPINRLINPILTCLEAHQLATESEDCNTNPKF